MDAKRAREVAEKVRSDIDRITAELEERRARGTAVKTIARLEKSLERLHERLPAALEKWASAAKREAKFSRFEKIRASFERRLEKSKNEPSISAKWKKERKQEDRRVAKRRAELAARQAAPEPALEPVNLPPPIAQPTAEELAAPYTPAPRPGLLPGEWSMKNASSLPALLDEDPPPSEWTPRHVAVRLIEAHDVLRRLPMADMPCAHGSIWPAYKQDPRLGEPDERRVIVRPSAAEIARMNEAIVWPMRFLSDRDRWDVADLNWWAFDAIDEGYDPDGGPQDLLAAIATGLNNARVPVR